MSCNTANVNTGCIYLPIGKNTAPANWHMLTVLYYFANTKEIEADQELRKDDPNKPIEPSMFANLPGATRDGVFRGGAVFRQLSFHRAR